MTKENLSVKILDMSTTITNLRAHPTLLEKTLRLIEKSFQYKAPFKFSEDFASLIHESNHQNCFILIDENETVLAHIGVREREMRIGTQSFMICLLGGIAVDEARRGEGHFQTLLTDVLAEKRSDATAFVLWSDQEKLYKKFGFFLCGQQFEVELKTGPKHLKAEKFKDLSGDEKAQIKKLYETSFAATFLTLQRTEADWKLIEATASADLYVKRSDSAITDYFVMNKGQDLDHIIYEYGSSHLASWLKEASSYGKVWMAKTLTQAEYQQYQFFFSPADLNHFIRFVSACTAGKVVVRNINVMKQEVFFDIDGETLMLGTEDFLRGLLGPGEFEEFGELPAIFISGLDSI
jgi:predicted N-acetyltransferase YhbS